MAATPILEMRNISMSFPGVRALDSVDFRLFKGEVHALMGQNGAGKSTLVKVLTGVYHSSSGEMLLGGKKIRPDSPAAARKLGISAVYQEVNLCPNLSVAENIFIGREPTKLGLVDWKAMNEGARELLGRLNVSIDVTRLLSSYSIAIQQMVAIARVLGISADVLVLDEPTSSLDEQEVEQLFRVVARLREEGMAILFITHFLDQVYAIADRITVLRNGQLCGERLASELPKLELVAMMLGKELGEFSMEHKAAPQGAEEASAGGGEALLEARGLGLKGSMAPFDLKVGKGDVLGFAGLLGSGRTEAARLLFGIDQAGQGEIRFKGKRLRARSPRQAVRAGMGFCSEDRKSEGILAELSVRENIILALQGRKGIFRYIPRKRQEEIADSFIAALGIKTSGTSAEARQLSGGNQQKMLLARWLATEPELLILDEPTRGIDVGAKLEIMELILSLAGEGKGIVFISSEFEELIRCSGRLAVFKDKAKVAELAGDSINERDIMRAIAEGR